MGDLLNKAGGTRGKCRLYVFYKGRRLFRVHFFARLEGTRLNEHRPTRYVGDYMQVVYSKQSINSRD